MLNGRIVENIGQAFLESQSVSKLYAVNDSVLVLQIRRGAELNFATNFMDTDGTDLLSNPWPDLGRPIDATDDGILYFQQRRKDLGPVIHKFKPIGSHSMTYRSSNLIRLPYIENLNDEEQPITDRHQGIDPMKKRHKTVVINIAITLVLLFLIESIASIAWYQAKRTNWNSGIATIDVLNNIKSRINADSKRSDSEKLDLVLELRDSMEVYPAYFFDPQLHVDFPVYSLSHPIESTIVYCNENDRWSIFQTDEIGFRNPTGQLGSDVDYIFIGDSFAEGACVDEKDTFAGVFRQNGLSVMNLGRAGAGPIFQLATLREYGPLVHPSSVIWYVFTGNDLYNLREEKTTLLSLYVQQEDYSQRLFEKRLDVSDQLKSFLDKEILLFQQRRELNLSNPLNHAFGETLDVLEAENKEVFLLERVAEKILTSANNLGARLFIVIINHPAYDHEIQDLTSSTIVDFARRTDTGYLVVERQKLTDREKYYFSKDGTHFSPDGYTNIAVDVLRKVRD